MTEFLVTERNQCFKIPHHISSPSFLYGVDIWCHIDFLCKEIKAQLTVITGLSRHFFT